MEKVIKTDQGTVLEITKTLINTVTLDELRQEKANINKALIECEVSKNLLQEKLVEINTQIGILEPEVLKDKKNE